MLYLKITDRAGGIVWNRGFGTVLHIAKVVQQSVKSNRHRDERIPRVIRNRCIDLLIAGRVNCLAQRAFWIRQGLE